MSRKSIVLLCLFTVSLLTSCSKDSEPTTSSVAGKWKLTNVSGTFAGIDNDISPGLITWDFNPITQTVTVVNNNPENGLWDVFETGVYNYHIVTDAEYPCGEIIRIDNNDMGCFVIENDSFIIDQSVADGFRLTLQH